MILALHTDLKFSDFVKALIRIDSFLIFCLFLERHGVDFGIVAIMKL